jgi:two-component system chemotaxis sensor kinase CheA
LTNTIDLQEYLGAYLAEAEEQLALANAKLLQVDASIKQGETNPRAVRDLFRALHTIKSLSAMVGVDPIVAIAHCMESALRLADRSDGKLSADAVDTLLKGVRAIEQRVRALAEKKPIPAPPEGLLEAIDQIKPDSAKVAGATRVILNLDPALASKLAPFELAALACDGKDGRRAVRGDFMPSPSKVEKGLSINTVRERVGAIAEIVKVIPVSVLRTVDAPGGLSFALLVVTSASDADLAAAIGIEPDALQPLGGVGDHEVDDPWIPPEEVEVQESPSLHRRSIVRVDVERLDDAMEQLSALIVTRSRLARAVSAMAEAGVNTRELAQIVKDNSRQLRDLRAAILRVRMVPVSEVLDRVPLIMRGLSRESGKQVRLLVETGNVELDKAVAERVFPAIVHIVRNAVDHAIEAPNERLRAGKPPDGTLRIVCSTHSNTRLELSISDDGAGVDRAAVARRIGREIGSGDDALLDALCLAGLSTRAEATTTSGRGLGMDIVRRIVVNQLGGELFMKTARGIGTTFTLRVPLTIAIVDAFTFECAGQRFVVPVSTVDEILEIDREKVRHGPSRATKGEARYAGLVERRGEAIPLVDLASIFHLPSAAGAIPRQALLVRRENGAMAFGIDRVQGQQEAVVRPLTDPLVQVPGIAGATDLGDGRPTLVLDLVALGATLLSRDKEHAA